MKPFQIGLAALLLPSAVASAAFTPGGEVFTNMAGTGTVTENAEARGGSGWYDYQTNGSSTPYRFVSNGFLTYQEVWPTARPLGTLFLASPGQENRGTSGNIYVQTTSSGPFNLLGTFNNANQTVDFYDLNVGSAFGIRVEITGGAADAYQVGSLGIYEERFDNIAQGLPRIFNDADAGAVSKGNVTDQKIQGDSLATQFRSNPSIVGLDEWVGVDFGVEKQLLGLLVDISPFSDWAWTDFDVQVFRVGSWDTLGRASAVPTNDLYWIDFGGVEAAEQVRLFGSASGPNPNNPGNGPGGDGRIISEIMAFEFVAVPEPAFAMPLALAGLAMLRRRN